MAIAHFIAGVFIAGPVLGLQASIAMTNYIDQAITPRLQAEAESTHRQLTTAQADRDTIMAQVTESQNQIAQAQTEQNHLQQAIEARKNSDIYVLAQIMKARAEGNLVSAREQLAAFQGKFPSSSLNGQVQTQLSEVENELTLAQAQKKQEEADAARAAAQARADLLARAAKGEVTLSEMRQVLIGKTRPQVSDLLGLPSGTASDSWGYNQQMIFNPLTNQKSGLIVYFNEGIVQGVDYGTPGGSP